MQEDQGINILTGTIQERAAEMDDNTFDAILCDPPYALGAEPDPAELLRNWLAGQEHSTGRGFMAKEWDAMPGPGIWAELLRVAKPGAYLFAFGGTRTADLLSVAIRLAGWQRIDQIAWVYAQGFPKSHNIAKATGDPEWDGYGTALSPSHEPILIFRKPIDGTYANNARKWGCGGINIEGGRIPISDGAKMGRVNRPGGNGWKNSSGGPNAAALNGEPTGRWPKNLIIDGSDEVRALFPQTKSGTGAVKRASAAGEAGNTSAAYGRESREPGTEIATYGDAGSAARMFFCAKPSPKERHGGLVGLPAEKRDDTRHAEQKSQNGGTGNPYNRGAKPVKNTHPTVKPLALCKYLAALLIPPESHRDTAKLLVPFSGSGSEMIGSMQAGWKNITGIEMVERHVEIAELRIKHWDTNAEVSEEESPEGWRQKVLL